MNFDSLYGVGCLYMIARRIAFGIVLLIAAGVGVTVYRLQHSPVYYDAPQREARYIDA